MASQDVAGKGGSSRTNTLMANPMGISLQAVVSLVTLTYHVSVLLARSYLSSLTLVASQVVAGEEGEGHGAPEAVGVV